MAEIDYDHYKVGHFECTCWMRIDKSCTQEWKKVYDDASTSLIKRQEEVDKAADLIEQV